MRKITNVRNGTNKHEKQVKSTHAVENFFQKHEYSHFIHRNHVQSGKTKKVIHRKTWQNMRNAIQVLRYENLIAKMLRKDATLLQSVKNYRNGGK